MKKNNDNLKSMLFCFLTAGTLSLQVQAQDPPEAADPTCNNCQKVVIVFGELDIGSGPKTCPLYVKEPVINVDADDGNRYDGVKWVAKIKNQETGKLERYKEGFSIYFSPFETSSNPITDSVKRGVALSPPILGHDTTKFPKPNKHFDIVFKYTVIGKECKKFPLDPRIKIQ